MAAASGVSLSLLGCWPARWPTAVAATRTPAITKPAVLFMMILLLNGGSLLVVVVECGSQLEARGGLFGAAHSLGIALFGQRAIFLVLEEALCRFLQDLQLLT